MYQLDFAIQGLPLLPNQLLGRHWSVKKKERDKWGRDIGFMVLGKKPPRALERAAIELVRGSSRQPDFDNLTASFKPILDSLKFYGIIKDDSPKHVNVTYVWEYFPRKKGPGYIRVKVTECTA